MVEVIAKLQETARKAQDAAARLEAGGNEAEDEEEADDAEEEEGLPDDAEAATAAEATAGALDDGFWMIHRQGHVKTCVTCNVELILIVRHASSIHNF
jgi:hypothetical protein